MSYCKATFPRLVLSCFLIDDVLFRKDELAFEFGGLLFAESFEVVFEEDESSSDFFFFLFGELVFPSFHFKERGTGCGVVIAEDERIRPCSDDALFRFLMQSPLVDFGCGAGVYGYVIALEGYVTEFGGCLLYGGDGTGGQSGEVAYVGYGKRS